MIPIVGIDPGASGGIAFLGNEALETDAWKMPPTTKDLWEHLRSLRKYTNMVVLEQVHAMPKQGVASTFKFGRSFGEVYMGLVAATYRIHMVTPAKWMRAMGVPKKGAAESKTVHKNRLKALAQELFPDIKVTLATADALLLAEYGRRHTT